MKIILQKHLKVEVAAIMMIATVTAHMMPVNLAMKVMEAKHKANKKANTKDLRQVTSVINVIMYTVAHKIDTVTVGNVKL